METQDVLTLTIRVHDPKEKADANLSACWVVVKVLRSDIGMPVADFVAKYIAPDMKQFRNLKLT